MTDHDLPRGPVAPLAAPAGAFDGAYARGARRRQRKAMIAGGTAAVVAAVALGGGFALAGGPERRDSLQVASPTPVATSESPVPALSPSAEPSATPSAAATPAATAPASPTTPARATPQAPAADDRTSVPGYAVTAAGQPVEGMWVSRHAGGTAWTTLGRTGPDGRFDRACGEQTLLTGWAPGSRQDAATLDWAAVLLPAPDCAAPAPEEASDLLAQDVVLQPGAVLTSRVYYYDSPSRGYKPDPGDRTFLHLYVDAVPYLQVQPATVDGTYRFVGLPAGGVSMQDTFTGNVDPDNRPRDLTVTAGSTGGEDWFSCKACDQGRGVVYGGVDS